MQTSFASCDWGTTNFRLRNLRDGVVLNEIRTTDGVSTLKAPADFLSVLKVAMEQIGARAPVLVSGMASSSIGWKELPYAKLPFRLDGRDAVIDEVETGIFLISGVSGPDEIMRGEEIELLGLDNIEGDALVVLPGTHSKHCLISNGALTDFRTFMTGELHAVLSAHSILAKTVFPGWNEQAFVEGVVAGSKQSLLGSLFRVRTRSVLGKQTAVSNGSYLSGLLIGSELASIPTSVPLILAAGGTLAGPYQTAFSVMGLNSRSRILTATESAMLAVKGQEKLITRLVCQ